MMTYHSDPKTCLTDLRNDLGKAATKKKPEANTSVEPGEVVIAYKAFEADLKCRDFQFEVGKTYEQSGRIEVCQNGFHACENPFDVFNYYPLGSRLAVVEMSGAISRQDGSDSDSKLAAARITIKAELTYDASLIKRAVEWVLAKAKGNTATGDRGHAAATGDRGHAAATGDRGHAAATGYSGHAAATGYRGHAAATGDRGHAAATGYRGHAAVKGHASIAASLGEGGTAKAEAGGAISLACHRWNRAKGRYDLVAVRSSLVGENGVEAGKAYRLTEAGEFEETSST